MALAIRLDQLIRDGVVADQAELARCGYVSRARLTQIMNLLCLAPDIQEEILFLPPTEAGYDAVSERELRPIVGVQDCASNGECGTDDSIAKTESSPLKRHSATTWLLVFKRVSP